MGNEELAASYARRGRRVLGRVGQRAVRVATTPQRQREELIALRAELADTQGELRQARATLEEAKADLQVAKLTADGRRAADPVEETIRRVRAENLTFLAPPALRDLALAVADVETNRVRGLVVEAGTALGGSGIVLASAKDAQRPMKVYDVFGLTPAPSERDGEDAHERFRTIAAGEAEGLAGETYYGYRDHLYDEVTQSFERLGVALADHRVELVRGLFQDTIELDEPVALAHLDGDWYDSTMTCLERIAPLLVSGGRIILDDYAMWSGCRAAVDHYFKDRGMDFRFEQHQRLHVVRR